MGAPPSDSLEKPHPCNELYKSSYSQLIRVILPYRSVLISLLRPWDEQHTQNEELLRPWPVIDPALPRGTLRGMSSSVNSVEKGTEAKDIVEAPNKSRPSKRRRIEVIGKPPDNVEALPLPNVPGVPPEKIEAMIASGQYRRCGMCAACTASHVRACQALDAVATWDENLGGVTGEMVRNIASALAASTGKGLRCGACKSCRHRWQSLPACETVKAITCGKLPLRFQLLLENTAVESSLVRQQQVAAALAAKYKNASNDKTNPVRSTQLTTLESDTFELDALESEEDERWISWAPYVASGPNEGCRTRSLAAARKQGKLASRGDGKGGSSHDGVINEEITDWVCRARLPTGPDGLLIETCGHANSANHKVCGACGTVRWDGPCGQLRARIIAALSTGGYIALQTRPLEEVAGMIATKMALESGTLPGLLPGMDPLTEKGGYDEDHSLLVADVYAMLHSVLEERRQVPCDEAASDWAPQELEKQHPAKAARIARHTGFALAVADLDLALTRLVDEQMTLRHGNAPDTENHHENDSQQPTNYGNGGENMHWLSSELGPGDHLEGPGAWLAGPSSSQNRLNGPDVFLGFEEFRERVSAALQRTEESTDDTNSAVLRSICQQLYVSPPPEGWSAGAVTLLVELLGQRPYVEQLHLAAEHGGPVFFRRALFLMLRRVAGHRGATDLGGGCASEPAFSPDEIQNTTQGATSQHSRRKTSGRRVQSSQNTSKDDNKGIPFPFPTSLDNMLEGWERELHHDNANALDRSFSDGRTAVSNETDRGARKVSYVSMNTLGFVYKLMHSILDEAALGRAQARCPTSLPSVQRSRVLE